ncbi:histidine kinase [Mucilaginibacter frigoritolerans]|jgi:two-component system, NarL family, sensor kinase|uniref:Oxygen sensor histidine kinase NreB n=1 Tax=Mucilaginibacter frigoritolerans TaxID=652788 RepID=A0A562U6T2_9SPHI|nr:ATP-binding protein [Mucilaginibacter frigoritolerans]TWJ01478.1 histidine kinase [Mucilaginibacter frigoritolerans]
MADYDIKELVLITTIIFLIAPAFIIAYISVYNRRKKKHIEEKVQMQFKFEAEIAKAQLEVQEQTMQTIGADLHDNIGQLLSLTSLTLNSIELDKMEKAEQKINASIDLVLRSIKEMRLLGKLLQGDQLVAMGLSEAIKHEINWMERSGKYEVTYTQADDIPLIKNADKDLIIFRILQEVLNNIIKHAFASQIYIDLEYIDKKLKLQIADNGVGFALGNIPAEQRGMGLFNIHKRAGIIGGEASIISNPGAGTNVTVFIPYP